MQDNLNYKLIGTRIKTHRKKLKLTQETVSEEAGISSRHMSNIENGNDTPSLACLVNIANALNTTTDYLLMDNVKAASTPQLLNEAKTLFDDFTSEEIYLIVEMAKTFKKSIKNKNLKIIENDN